MKCFSSTKITQLLLLVFVSFVFISCASNAKYITDSAKYTSYGIDYHDIEKMVDNNAKSLLKSDFIKDLTLKSQDKKILAISDIQNDTDENIDMELLSRKFVRKIRDSKKFILTNAIAGSGNSTDSMIRNSRKLRDDEEFNQHTTQQKGNLISPNYSLSGKISQRVTRIRNDIRIDYQFLLTLTDLKTGTVVWDNEEVIFKLIAQEEIEEQLAEQRITNSYPSYSTKTKKQTPKRRSTSKNHFVFGLDMSANLGEWVAGKTIYHPEPMISVGAYGGGLLFFGSPKPMFPMNLSVGYERDIGENWALGVNTVYTYIFTSTEQDSLFIEHYSTTTTFDFTIHRLGLEILGIYKTNYKTEWFAKVRLSKDFTLLNSSVSVEPGNIQIPLNNSYISLGLGFISYSDSGRVGFFWEILSYENVLLNQYISNYMMSGFGTAMGLRIRI